jgi:hypothetical protein
MDKINIINYWSYFKNNDNLIINLANIYSKNNNLELVNLNLLDEVFDNNYWFLCKKTGKLFLLNFQNRGNQDYLYALSEINRYTFTLVLFDVNNYNNIISTVKSIDSFNKKPSRDVRHDRINILKEQAPIKKRKLTDMISATSIRNYMLNDPILDYLKESIDSKILD